MTTVIEPAAVAARARQVLATWQADPEWQRLWNSCAKYSSDWDDFYGYPIILDYNAVRGYA